MSSQTDSQNLSNEVEVDVQEPDCLSQTSSSFVEVIALNVLLSSVIGPSAKINFTKPKKNHTPVPTSKGVQTKIFLKLNSPSPAKGVVIKEPSPNSVRPSLDEVLGKDKEKVVEPSPKVKPALKQAPSSSKAA
ncbi:hypothetical protein Adt_05294 [Abeliophyllum distichum]|uniref:Uncharacterized protein n=1 Tax=Abeliophyllum distichum TaxID=126358 RepID=A0ABD1V3Q3_9LAMI